jgi:uncharacterized protein (TIGR02328 family)
MRLWHYAIIPKLPKQWLLGQHKECCMMRGRGWGKRHSTVDYAWKYTIQKLYFYHLKVMTELIARGVNVDKNWLEINYRGKFLPIDNNLRIIRAEDTDNYEEHDEAYLQECLENLKQKGIILW